MDALSAILTRHTFPPVKMGLPGPDEAALQRILEAGAYGEFRISRGGAEHRTWQIDHDGHRIWGITANLTRRFRDLALDEAAA